MKLSWLASALLIGGGATASTSSGKALGGETRLLLKKGVPYQQQRQDRSLDGASVHQQHQQQQQSSPSVNSAATAVHLDKLTLNRTRPDHLTKTQSEQHLEDPLPVVTLRITSPPEQKPLSPPPPVSAPQTEPSTPSHDSDENGGSHVDLSQEDASSAVGAGGPASANRAIAGMSVGLVSVMLIFTVFL
ncbi:hypothetical protein B0J18DRAFT_219138 [Chaetomium sp. MPI-SDFR-AT-0129]|nr:hypothetical protein B0J18DRAFT_219138 [Chaetomium sp. MPI-SDFR-AT-0129]